MSDVKTVIIRFDDLNNIVIHCTMEKAPYTVFCVFLSIGYTPLQARICTDRALYTLQNTYTYEHQYTPQQPNREEDI